MIHKITLSGYSATTDDISGVLILGTYDSYGIERIQLELGPEWNALVIKATFNPPTGSEPVTVVADTSGQLRVPQEATSSAGQGAITFVGTAAGLQRISTDLPYIVKTHSQIEGATPSPTPSEWEQFVAQVQQARDDAEAAAQAAEDSQTAAAGSASDAANSAEAAAQSAQEAQNIADGAVQDIATAKDAAVQAVNDAGNTAVQAVQTAATTGVKAIQQAHQAALDDIATDRQQALTDIETEGEKQTSAITSSGAAALEAIGQVEQTAIGQVHQAGQTQQTAIEQAGQSWQQQIAAAGTAELGRWAPAIWDTAPLAAEHDIYAAEGAPLRVTQQGETQQNTTTGRNLLPWTPFAETTKNGVTYECVEDGIIKVTGTATASADSPTMDITGLQLPPGKYCMIPTGYGDLLPQIVVRKAATGQNYWYSTNVIIEEGDQPQYFYISCTQIGVALNVQVYAYLQAGEGPAASTNFEPYTGGAPSPSPDYPQEIEGTGLNGKIVLDGSADEAWVQDGQAGKYRYCIFDGLPDAVAPDAARPATCYCNRYRIISGDDTYRGILGLALYADNVYLVDPAITSVESLRAALAENPLEIYYVSSDRSKQAYTVGTSTEDDAGDYHGQALAIGSQLYGDGSVADTVANDVPSGCDQRLVLTGQEAWEPNASYYVLFNSAEDNTGVKKTGYCNRAPYSFQYNGKGLFVDAKGVWVGQKLAAQYTDVAAWKAELASAYAAGNPYIIWYRSTAYTEAADLHIDKVTRRWRMVELDGTEIGGRVATSGGGNPYYYQMADAKFSGGLATSTPGWEDATKSTHFLPGNAYAEKGNLAAVMTHSGVSLCRLGFDPDPFASYQEMQSWLAAQKSAGTPVRVLYQLATPEEYASDPHTLPALGSLPETVEATGQSTVSYSADTKHYIDSKLQAIAAQQLNLMIGGIGT